MHISPPKEACCCFLAFLKIAQNLHKKACPKKKNIWLIFVQKSCTEGMFSCSLCAYRLLCSAKWQKEEETRLTHKVSHTPMCRLQHRASYNTSLLFLLLAYSAVDRGQISVTHDLTLSMSPRFWSACIHYVSLHHVCLFLSSLCEPLFILEFTFLGVKPIDNYK